MTRARIAALLIVTIAASAAAAKTFVAEAPKPCFVAGAHAYRISDKADANVTVLVSKTAAAPNLRVQLVNDPATADFVLVDDSDQAAACDTIGAIKSIRLDTDAANGGKPDLTVALSGAGAPYKIYVRSAHYSPQDAAALFAVMRQDTRRREVASRD